MSDSPPSQPGEALRRRAAFALAPGLIAFSMGQTVLFAVAGPVIREIGLTEVQLGMIVSAAALVFVAASPVWGRISDRWGRKTVIVFGLVTYSLLSFAFAGVMQFGLNGALAAGAVFFSLLGLRLLYAALGSGIQPASVALMADLSGKTERASAVAIVGAAFGLGMILGPASAAALVGWGVLAPLYAIAALGLVSAGIAALFLDGRPRAIDTAPEQAEIDMARLVPVMAAGLILFTAVSALQQTMAFFIQDYLSADAAEAARATGICFMVMAAATLIAQGGLIQMFKPGPGTLLRLGLPLMLAGLALYAFPAGFAQIVVASGLIGLGFGLANPGLIAAASLRTGTEAQGATAGLMQAMMAGGYVIGPLAGTALYEGAALWTAAFIGGAIAMAFLIVLALKLNLTEPAPAA